MPVVRLSHSSANVDDALGCALAFPPGLSPKLAYEHLVSKKQVSRDSKQMRALESLESLYQQLLRLPPQPRSASDIAATVSQATEATPPAPPTSSRGGFFGLFSRKSTVSSSSGSSSSVIAAAASLVSSPAVGPQGVYLYGSPGCGKVSRYDPLKPSASRVRRCCGAPSKQCLLSLHLCTCALVHGPRFPPLFIAAAPGQHLTLLPAPLHYPPHCRTRPLTHPPTLAH